MPLTAGKRQDEDGGALEPFQKYDDFRFLTEIRDYCPS
jgi:hypothetical protein